MPHYPDISVVVLAYNHERFIEQCLSSIVGQQTEYSIEIIVGEDGSDDRTAEIIKSKVAAFPQLIRPMFRKRDTVIRIRGQETPRFNQIHSVQAARGRYLSFIDGDDFFSADNKLQTQARILDSHRDLGAVTHECATVDSTGALIRRSKKRIRRPAVCSEDIAGRGIAAHISTYMFRNNRVDFPDWFNHLPIGDWPMAVHLLEGRPICHLYDVMTAHRIHDKGRYSGADEFSRRFAERLTAKIIREAHPSQSIRRAAREREIIALLNLVHLLSEAGKLRGAQCALHLADEVARFATPRARMRYNRKRLSPMLKLAFRSHEHTARLKFASLRK